MADNGADQDQGASSDGSPSSTHTRHYPLDIPDAPFRRYEHRRLNAHDIMVHRIMEDYMNPSPATASMYDEWLLYPPPQFRNLELDRDHKCLQNKLFTRHTNIPKPKYRPLSTKVPSLHESCCGKPPVWETVEGPRRAPPTMGDAVLNMVMRHYLETDDTVMRAWVSRASPPRRPAGPKPSFLSAATAAQRSSPLAREQMRMHFEISLLVQETGNENAFHSLRALSHLRSLQSKVVVQDQLMLYDGGVFIPRIRQGLDLNAIGMYGALRGMDQTHWTLKPDVKLPREDWYRHQPEPPPLSLPAWPEREPRMRFILQPVWKDRLSLAESLRDSKMCPPLDLSLNTSRGRNSGGIWATGRPRHMEQETQGRYRRPGRRCASEPPLGSFTTADLPKPGPFQNRACLQIVFPRMTLARLDKRSRRRSLSRTRIEEMFDWGADVANLGAGPEPEPRRLSRDKKQIVSLEQNIRARKLPHCENCMDTSHLTSECLAPCGHCGAPSHTDVAVIKHQPNLHQNPHLAPQCSVARKNRCKCVPFPTFHTAKQCGIPCHRNCGNNARRGSFQHPNAMTCESRCCMCGIKGHSGQDCRMRTCRCGGHHLGQDCSWNPACRVPGCRRFLCGLHCRECGSDKKPFVSWKCGKCLRVNGGELTWGDADSGVKRRGRGRTRQREHSGKEDEKGAENSGLPIPAISTETGTETAPIVAATVEAMPLPPSVFGDPRPLRKGGPVIERK
ncbi:hypothetical protein B0H63DRAFT_466216 [Podospora didyma]|uniref:Uncharacterized protein n=1 Tax=Podospora didyma TaxID=330526 RepID=A0AAE0P085_9PEZI|nr:hypothetical protein B0H63DRAFT_466216 [Podospora didyma]